MKKLLLTSFFLFCLFAAQAQGVNLGIKAGLNMAKLSGEIPQLSDLKMKNGLHLGIFADLKLSDKFAISPEILYSKQGTKAEEGDLNLNYLNVPVFAKIYFAKILNIHVGPQFGALMSAVSKDEDVKANYKDYDFSVAAGLGLDIPLGIKAGARYNLGLGSISELDADLSNQYFQIYVGYSFL